MAVNPVNKYEKENLQEIIEGREPTIADIKTCEMCGKLYCSANIKFCLDCIDILKEKR